MKIEVLWSQDDQYALDLCIGAVARGDIDRAMLALEGANHERQREAERTLAHWGAQIGSAAETPVGQADALRELLVNRLGFTGDNETYDHPRNSQLAAVLERRRGLPILLSGVWMVVGRHADIPVAGIGLPGRFVVRVGGDEGVYVDPFNGGAFLSEADCRRIAREHTDGALDWHESFLDAVEPQAFMARVSHNLVASYNRSQDSAGLYRSLRFLEAMRPEDPEIPLMRAETAVSVGAFPRALRIYRTIAQHYADTDAGQRARDRLEHLARITIAEG